MKQKDIQTLRLQIADRLKEARKNAGYKSARQFAITHGIPPRTYQKHESGFSEMNLTTMVTYCSILNITLLWLQTGKHNNLNPLETPETN